MKKFILALTISVLFVGCASHESDQGGTSSNEGYNNATHGTGTSTATNQGHSTTDSMQQ